MRMIMVLVLALLSGCGGQIGAQWSTEQSAEMPGPNITNDDHYDGGVFDADDIM